MKGIYLSLVCCLIGQAGCLPLNPALAKAGAKVSFQTSMWPGLSSSGFIELEEEETAFGDDKFKELVSPLRWTPNWRELLLGYTQVTDRSVPDIASFDNLEVLDVSSTRITGEGVTVLARLPKLRRLLVSPIYVSRYDVDLIKETRPNLKIVRTFGLAAFGSVYLNRIPADALRRFCDRKDEDEDLKTVARGLLARHAGDE